MVGADGLKREGVEQNQHGKGLEAQGQLSDLGQGVGDRVTGAVGGAFAGVTGNRDQQQRFQNQHDDGKTAQRSVEHDLSK